MFLEDLMKKYLLLCFWLLCSSIFSQAQLFTNNAPNQVVTLDLKLEQFNFVPGQIIIKLKDDVNVALAKSNGVVSLGINTLDVVLQKYNISSANKVFPNEKRILNKKMLKAFNGVEFEQPSLHNIYKIESDISLNVLDAIDELKQDPHIEYAEPNYILSVLDFIPTSPALNENEMQDWIKEHNSDLQINNTNSFTPNDPLYSQQWSLPAAQVDAVWDSTTGDTTQVIAILDTGVDWLHPDLKNKIWINPNEIPNNGMDDDNNGYIDDVRGWDFVNYDNNPLDDNGHGTHVAGIAAAEGNNGIGVSGISWGAKIMPVKMLNNKGYGDIVTSAQAVYYATQNGATILNMSFGVRYRSSTMEMACMYACANSELVAAAGNESKSIYELTDYGDSYAFFPAGFNFVFGVQTNDSYSNYDPDGPLYSEFITGDNYELVSYGSGILSTFPGGSYKMYSGTSMAAPMISGILSLYNSYHVNSIREDRWANFIHQSTPVNAYKTIFNSMEKSIFDIVSYELTDSLDGNDYDNQADAGETIKLWARIRNTFKTSLDTRMKIQLSDVYRPYYNEYINFIKDTVKLGTVSSFRELHNKLNPFLIQLKPNIPNEDKLEFELLVWDETQPDTSKQVFTISVFNGEELSGLLSGNIILTPDKVWMINNSARLTTGSTMKILPGTRLVVNSSFDNRGYIEAIGTPDSMIILENESISLQVCKYVKYIGNGSNDISVGYCTDSEFTNLRDVYGESFYNCKFSLLRRFIPNNDSLVNCKIENIRYISGYPNSPHHYINVRFDHSTLISNFFDNSYFYKCVFNDNFYSKCDVGQNYAHFSRYSNVKFTSFYNAKNWLVKEYPHYIQLGLISDLAKLFAIGTGNVENLYNNVFIMGRDRLFYSFIRTEGSEDQVTIANQYFGTNQLGKIHQWVKDFQDDATLPYANIIPMEVPSDSVHGFVWKVLVNGKDAQDEYVEPVGVGYTKFEVYFNRPMDPNYTPQLTFGGIFPYTSFPVVDSSAWSSDYKIWRGFYKVKLYTGDGINRIRVAGARDLEGFEIPVEDQRFEFTINAATANSIDFMATAGLGKVNLEWRNPDREDVPDLLGYNIYRMEHINDTTLTSPVMINSSLVADTLYTDYDVVPNKKYYYYYRVVRTDFSESDSSKVVSSIPFTAAIGDGNGDLTVNVLDVLTTVSYILGQNPQPFIFDAADIVRDSVINVLDVVGNVNLILHGTSLPDYLAKNSSGSAKLELIGNDIYLTTENPVAGIQLLLKGKGLSNAKFKFNSFHNFENMSSTIGDSLLIVLLYNMNNNQLEAGKYYIGSVEGNFNALNLNNAVLSDNKGAEINLNIIDNGVSSIPSDFYLEQNYPNPFNLSTTIQYGIPNKTNGKIVIYNILGQKIKTFELGDIEPGKYKLVWDGKNNYGSVVASGVYIFRFESQKFTLAKKMMLIK